MKNDTYSLEFITPCFCAGAEPGKAEIRVPSIRGELRWWFRVLGATAEQERGVFGGVHDGARSSALVIRVRDVEPLCDEADLRGLASQNTGKGYLCHFIRVSGKANGSRNGPRWQAGAFFSPGTRFSMEVLTRHPLDPTLSSLVDRALQCFRTLGTLGLRSTRGLGAWCERGGALPRGEDVARLLDEIPGMVWTFGAPEKDWRAVLESMGTALREFRKKNRLSGKSETAVGCSNPRHASALHLRPVRTADGYLPVALYTDRTRKPELRSLADLIPGFFT